MGLRIPSGFCESRRRKEGSTQRDSGFGHDQVPGDLESRDEGTQLNLFTGPSSQPVPGAGGKGRFGCLHQHPRPHKATALAGMEQAKRSAGGFMLQGRMRGGCGCLPAVPLSHRDPAQRGSGDRHGVGALAAPQPGCFGARGKRTLTRCLPF